MSENWNFISLPYVPLDTDLTAVLAPIDGYWDLVEYYDASSASPEIVAVANEHVFGPAVGDEVGPFYLDHGDIKDLTLYSTDGPLALNPGEDYDLNVATGEITYYAGPLSTGEVLTAFYNYTQPANFWKSNSTIWLPQFNEIHAMDNKIALWVKLVSDDVYVTVGKVADISIELKAGWNFVAYPHHEEMQVQDALTGVPYNKVEGNDQAQPYGLEKLFATDIMQPGKGYWLKLTADYTWNIINT